MNELLIIRSRKFLSTSGDKMLTLFEDLKSSGAEAHLVEVSDGKINQFPL